MRTANFSTHKTKSLRPINVTVTEHPYTEAKAHNLSVQKQEGSILSLLKEMVMLIHF